MFRLGSIVQYDNGEYAMVVDANPDTGYYTIRFLSDEEELECVVHGELEVIA